MASMYACCCTSPFCELLCVTFAEPVAHMDVWCTMLGPAELTAVDGIRHMINVDTHFQQAARDEVHLSAEVILPDDILACCIELKLKLR
jgi:hypothetical protein